MAETAESSTRETNTDPTAATQRDFELAVEQDIDDEATIDEEETLEAGEGFNQDELDDLQKDAEVPIEDLLALYYNPGNERCDDATHVPLDDIQPEPLPPFEHHSEQQNGASTTPSPVRPRSASPSQNSTVNPPENQRITRGLAAAYQYFPDSDSSSSDEDYAPAEDWKKEIHVGPEHQAEVPETTCPDIQEDEKHDSKCLWSPRGITEQKLQKYVESVCGPTWDGGASCLMSKGDDEQALYVLLQCNYDCDEALKKFQSQPPPSQGTEEMTFWSEEECRNFELGLKTFGKNFYLIQQSKIPGRTVGDIVQFYYLWKKTERHDAFSWQLRSKKKISFHPGITDYMDRFLDENESAASSRAESPGRVHIAQPYIATEESLQSSAENHSLKRPSSDSTHYSSSSMMSGLIRVPQSYVPTPVIVSNDKEPPAKKPNLGESLINGPPPLKPHNTSQSHVPNMVSHVGNHMSSHATTTSHMNSHMMHVSNQITATTAPPASLPNTGLQFSPMTPSHHLNIHNMDSGTTYARLTPT